MQKTTTFLMFVGDQCGKAEEAVKFYISLFRNSEVKKIEYFKEGEAGGKEGTVKYMVFTLDGQEYMAIDSFFEHNFSFTPAISIYVNCETYEELDMLFGKLSNKGMVMMAPGDYGFSKKFTWVADQYGISWQLNLAA